MKYLVTGATGIVGKYLIKELLKDPDNEIVGVSRQVEHYYEDHPQRGTKGYYRVYGELTQSPIRLISNYEPDIVIHLAGKAITNSPAKDIYNGNVLTTLNLLECLKDRLAVKFILASTIVTDCYPLSVYAASKLSAEALLKSYTDIYSNIEGIAIRFCAVGGAGNKHGLLRDIVAKLWSNEVTLPLYGAEPGSTKPHIYAGDLARIINKLSQQNNFYDYRSVETICPEDRLSVCEVATIAMEMTGQYKKIEWQPDKVWRGDCRVVTSRPNTNPTFFTKYNSADAIKLAIADILREDYGVEKN